MEDQAKITAESGEIREVSANDPPNKLTNAGLEPESAGNAGNIYIKTERLSISDGGKLSSQADHAGGGKVTVHANESIHLSDGNITTTVKRGADDAGDIEISDPKAFVLNRSRIIANAHEGEGGNIRITTDRFIRSSDSLLDASSELGIDGLVEIESPDADISDSLMRLPPDFLPELRTESCADRSGQEVIRFTVSGRDGLPPLPENFLASPPLLSDNPDMEKLYHRGAFDQLVRSVEKETAEGMLLLAYACQSLGYFQKALDALSSFAQENHGRAYDALIFSRIGYLHFCLGNTEAAGKYLEAGIREARFSENELILASVLNHRGIFLASVRRDDSGATSAWMESLGQISASEHGARLKSKVLINLARLSVLSGNPESRDDALSHIASLTDSHDKAWDMVSLSLLIPGPEPRGSEVVRHRLLTAAKQISESLGDRRAAAYASGYLGQLYENAGRRSEAIRLTRSAISLAQQEYCPEILYRWQRQLGRLFRAGGDIEKSVRAYENAIETLNPIRSEFFTGNCDGKSVFHQKIRPVYLELAELLLEEAEKGGEEKLHKARDTMERLKHAELEDFFQDECVTAMKRKPRVLDQMPSGIALLYPIVFPDHVSLLLTLPDAMTHIRVPADSSEGITVRDAAERFPRNLQKKVRGIQTLCTLAL